MRPPRGPTKISELPCAPLTETRLPAPERKKREAALGPGAARDGGGPMPNPNVVLSAFLSALALYGLRECAFEVWLCLVVLPALLYALCAERTSRTTLAGKHVLVTGASSGLGLELAKEAARRGAAAVLLVSRGREHLEAAAHACEAVATHPDFESARARADDAGRGAGSSAALLASRGARVVAPRGAVPPPTSRRTFGIGPIS